MADNHISEPLDYLYEELLPEEMAQARRHLAECPECRAAMRAIRETVKLYRQTERPVPPRGLAARVSSAAVEAARAPHAVVDAEDLVARSLTAAMPSGQQEAEDVHRREEAAREVIEAEFDRLKQEVLGEVRIGWRRWLFHPAWAIAASVFFIFSILIVHSPRMAGRMYIPPVRDESAQPSSAPSENVSVPAAAPPSFMMDDRGVDALSASSAAGAVVPPAAAVAAPARRDAPPVPPVLRPPPVVADSLSLEADSYADSQAAMPLEQSVSESSAEAFEEAVSPAPVLPAPASLRPSPSGTISQKETVRPEPAPKKKGAPAAASSAAGSLDTASCPAASDAQLRRQREAAPATAVKRPSAPAAPDGNAKNGFSPSAGGGQKRIKEEPRAKAGGDVPLPSPAAQFEGAAEKKEKPVFAEVQPPERVRAKKASPPSAAAADAESADAAPPPSAPVREKARENRPPPTAGAAVAPAPMQEAKLPAEMLVMADTPEAVVNTSPEESLQDGSDVVVDWQGSMEPPQLIARPTPINVQERIQTLTTLAGMAISSGEFAEAWKAVELLKNYDKEAAEKLAELLTDMERKRSVQETPVPSSEPAAPAASIAPASPATPEEKGADGPETGFSSEPPLMVFPKPLDQALEFVEPPEDPPMSVVRVPAHLAPPGFAVTPELAVSSEPAAAVEETPPERPAAKKKEPKRNVEAEQPEADRKKESEAVQGRREEGDAPLSRPSSLWESTVGREIRPVGKRHRRVPEKTQGKRKPFSTDPYVRED